MLICYTDFQISYNYNFMSYNHNNTLNNQVCKIMTFKVSISTFCRKSKLWNFSSGINYLASFKQALAAAQLA